MRNAHARSIFGPAARQGGLRSAAVAFMALIFGVAVPAPTAAAATPAATTVYVSLSGEPHTPLGWWDLSSCERPDVVGGVAAIEAVIDEAESPTTIYLCDGEYDASSTIDVGSKQGITLEGSRGAILNGNGDRIIHTNGSLVVRGLTLVNGSASNGAAIWGAFLFLEDVEFLGNESSGQGGAVYAVFRVTIRESRFEGNTSDDFGGAVYAPVVETSNSEFIGNISNNGGAIFASSQYVGHGNEYVANQADSSGGAIYAGSVRSSRDLFVENAAGTEGGAVSASTGAVQLSVFSFNTARSGGALAGGQVAVGSSRFTGNSAVYGGGLNLTSQNSSTLTSIRKNQFVGNQAEYGGGLAVTGVRLDSKSLQRLFYANAFKQNTASEAGRSIWCEDSSGVCFR